MRAVMFEMFATQNKPSRAAAVPPENSSALRLALRSALRSAAPRSALRLVTFALRSGPTLQAMFRWELLAGWQTSRKRFQGLHILSDPFVT
jgi:hypothetical protein